MQTLLRVWTRTDGGAGNKLNKKESPAPIKQLQLQAGAMNRDLAINSRPASAMPMASKNDTENIQPLQQQCNAVKQQISSPAPPPEIIEHRMSENGRTVVKRYFKGELLGKGGFAKCYLFTDCETNDKWACKVRVDSDVCFDVCVSILETRGIRLRLHLCDLPRHATCSTSCRGRSSTKTL